LTNTNEEALRITGLLIKNGRNAKLIQSNDSFRLYDLVEIRVFLNLIKKDLTSPIVSDIQWKNAKSTLFEKYSSSTCLDNIRRMLSDFESTHPQKYISDFEEFVFESNYDDFYEGPNSETIYVSTIHKSKGREFDSVYIMLKNSYCKDDAERRKIYVALSRAKSNLFIHCNTDLFFDFHVPGVKHYKDNNYYPFPTEIVIQTTHRDVVLSFFKYSRSNVFGLKSGDPLCVDDVYLTAKVGGVQVRVAKFSQAFTGRLNSLKEKGFVPVSAEVHFIVAWKEEITEIKEKDKEKEEEVPVILANIKLIKENPATN